ncbi:MAG TPA: hypothetical protein VFU01_15335, partial [Gemmatimonadaceae bacterium]|nr:hypothetical protein [Gemmatimonadaceae bacterium]
MTTSMREAACATLALAFLLAGCASTASRGAATPEFDLVITGGRLIDGTGAARYRADVAITGDRIALVSRQPIAATRARRTI